MSVKELAEQGLKLAMSIQSGSDYGTEYLDRTVYHTVYVTDANGNIMIDGNGDKIIRNQVLYLAGSYISKKELDNAMKVEKDFQELNNKLRDKMSAEGLTWRLDKANQTALRIQGVTGV